MLSTTTTSSCWKSTGSSKAYQSELAALGEQQRHRRAGSCAEAEGRGQRPQHDKLDRDERTEHADDHDWLRQKRAELQ